MGYRSCIPPRTGTDAIYCLPVISLALCRCRTFFSPYLLQEQVSIADT